MKIKIDHLIIFSLIFHILSTQGVLTYLFFDLFGIWEMKSTIHPISMMLLFVSFTLKYKDLKLKYEDLLFLVYAFILFLLLIYNTNSFFSFYIGFREVFVIFILSFFFYQFQFTKKQYNYLSGFLIVLVFVNLIMVFLTYYLGPEAYMKMLTGRYQWGNDEVTNFKISTFLGGLLRSPGIVGSSGALAYFALFSYFIFDFKKNQKIRKFSAFILLISTFTRSALLCLLIYEALKFISNKKNIKNIVKYGKVLIPILILGLIMAYQYNILSTESLFMRFEIWTNKINVEYNWLYGGAIGEVGGAIRGQGEESILDNYWLFLLYSTGLIGVFIWLIFFYEKAKRSKKQLYFTIGIVFSGVFVMLTQAIPFLVMFPLILANYRGLDDEI